MKQTRMCDFFLRSDTSNGCDGRHQDLFKNTFRKVSLEKHTEQCKSFRRLWILGQSNCKCWCHDRSKHCYKISAADERPPAAASDNMKITDFM